MSNPLPSHAFVSAFAKKDSKLLLTANIADTDESVSLMEDGEGQARLAAITRSPPPEGRGRWTLNLLRNKMVELEYVDNISRSTIHSELKKTN